MADYSFTERIGRAMYAAADGDLAKYDLVKQQAAEAAQKRADDIVKQQIENEKWKFEQQQQLQQNGYQPIGNFKGGDPKDFNALSVPGVGGYFKPMVDEPKTYSDKLAAMKLDAIKAMDPAAQQAYLTGQKPIGDPEAWRLANTLAVAENGGSLMSGIGENKDAYLKSRQSWYDRLKKGLVAAGQTGTTQPTQTASDIDSF